LNEMVRVTNCTDIIRFIAFGQRFALHRHVIERSSYLAAALLRPQWQLQHSPSSLPSSSSSSSPSTFEAKQQPHHRQHHRIIRLFDFDRPQHGVNGHIGSLDEDDDESTPMDNDDKNGSLSPKQPFDEWLMFEDESAKQARAMRNNSSLLDDASSPSQNNRMLPVAEPPVKLQEFEQCISYMYGSVPSLSSMSSDDARRLLAAASFLGIDDLALYLHRRNALHRCTSFVLFITK
jgi:hypothetical protein